MAAKKFTNIRSDSSSNSGRSTESRVYLGNYFPIRLRNGVISYGAWLQSYKAEQLRRLNTVLKTKIMSNEEIKERLKQHTQRKSPKGIWQKSSFLFDTPYILKHCKVTDPEELFSLKISNQGLNLANSEDFHFFTNLEVIDAEDNSLKLEAFKSFSRLIQLKLPLNKLTDLSVNFGEFPHLQYLDLSYNNLTGDCFKSLGLMPNLQYLNLGNNDISYLPADSTQCFSLSESGKGRYIRFPRLEVLKLNYNKLESPDIFIPLANITHLIYLDLEGNSIYHIPCLEKESTESFFPVGDSTKQDTQQPEIKRKETGYYRVVDDESQKDNLEKSKVAVKDVEYQKSSDQAERTLEDENLKRQDLSKDINVRENQLLEVLLDTTEELSISQNGSLASKVALPGSREILQTSEDKSQTSREENAEEAFGHGEGSVTSIERKTGHTEVIFGSLEDLSERREEVYSSKEEALSSREELCVDKERLPNIKEELSSVKERFPCNKEDEYGDRELLLCIRKASHSCDSLREGIKKVQKGREGSDGSRKGSHRSRKGSHDSRKGSCDSRKGSYDSRRGSDVSRKGSVSSRKGSVSSRKESEDSRMGSDGSRKGSDDSIKGLDDSRRGSDDSRKVLDDRRARCASRKGSHRSRKGLRRSLRGMDSSREGLYGSKEKLGSSEVIFSSREELSGSVVGYTESMRELSASKECLHICTNQDYDDSKDYCSGCLTDELAARTPLSTVLNDLSNNESFLSSHLSDEMLLLEEIPSIEDLKLFMNLSKLKETSDRLVDEEVPLESFNLLGIEQEVKEESPPQTPAVELDADPLHPTDSQLECEVESDEFTSDVYSFESSEQVSEESEAPIVEMQSKTCNCYSTRPVRENKEYKIPFSQLTILNLAHNNVFCQEALMAVADWPMIQQIFLFGNPIMANTREKEISMMTATLCDRLGVDVFCKPLHDQDQRHLEIQVNNSRKVKSVVRKVPKVPVEKLMAIEDAQPSWERPFRKGCFKTESSEEKSKTVSLEEYPPLVIEDSQTKSPTSDKALPKNTEDQPFFVTQPKEDGEFIGMKQSADGRKRKVSKKAKAKTTNEDLLNTEASHDENSSAYSPVKGKYKGYEVLFDDDDVSTKIISSNDKLMNINALRQALKTDLPFKRRIPKNFTQELVLKSKEAASKPGDSFEERIDKVLLNIREQTVLHEVNLGEIFSNRALYKEEYKEARRLIKRVENYYANSFFNKRRQKNVQDKNESKKP
ncbi:X-ray radiation resistance-associated protein 1-like isoform X2 [Octopus sinensis]|uniref:X-ray radiation resistance-associated protein 1-like isoform X2 n=1 Tax=Octopus sinensis TaxID=2607531 RepID=A0A7E6F5K1_9MOLL|nr:X-ray radiation resistance-associated protein 1-like isoform X2 [Octopus sinensis]